MKTRSFKMTFICALHIYGLLYISRIDYCVISKHLYLIIVLQNIKQLCLMILYKYYIIIKQCKIKAVKLDFACILFAI